MYYNINIFLDTYYVFEKLLSSPDDIIDVTQENNADSNNVGYTLLNTSKISCKMIYNLLIHKDPRVILVKNTKHTSDCSSQFRYPAIIDDKEAVVTKFDKFVSCKYYFITVHRRRTH